MNGMATLTINYPAGAQTARIVIDCRHGTTTIDQYTPPATLNPLTISELIDLAAASHELEEACGCAPRLMEAQPPT